MELLVRRAMKRVPGPISCLRLPGTLQHDPPGNFVTRPGRVRGNLAALSSWTGFSPNETQSFLQQTRIRARSQPCEGRPLRYLGVEFPRLSKSVFLKDVACTCLGHYRASNALDSLSGLATFASGTTAAHLLRHGGPISNQVMKKFVSTSVNW
jgi:hypothetical protein